MIEFFARGRKQPYTTVNVQAMDAEMKAIQIEVIL